MNELHKTLREDAEETLYNLVTEIHGAALKIADANGIEPRWLLRLALQNRTASLHKKVISKLVEVREAELLDIHNKGITATDVTSIGPVTAKSGGKTGG